jgi:hypothetical protein
MIFAKRSGALAVSSTSITLLGLALLKREADQVGGRCQPRFG